MRDAVFEERWAIGGFSLLGAFTDLFTDMRANEFACEFVRSKIRSIVHDAEVAAALCPTHPIGCKRLCVDSGYYATYNRANVTLVDVSSAPIERITPHGVRPVAANTRIDMLVLATGFDAFTGPLTRIDLRGRGGQHIRDKWQRRAAELPGPRRGRLSEPVQFGRRGQHVGFHQRDRVDRAPCRLDRRLRAAGCKAHGHTTIEASEEAESH